MIKILGHGRQKNISLFSFIAGAVCVIIGGVPLLKLKFLTNIPQIFSPLILKIALLVGGIMLLYAGLQIKNPLTGMIKGTTILAGLLLAAVGAIPLLIDLGWLNKYLPFIATLNIPLQVLQGLAVIFGLYLIYDAYLLSKQAF